MIVAQIECLIGEEKITHFIQTTQELYKKVIPDPYIMRFDILQATLLPTRFLLYIAFESEEASYEFRRSAPFIEWLHANPGLFPRAIETYLGFYHKKFNKMDPAGLLQPMSADKNETEISTEKVPRASMVVVGTIWSIPMMKMLLDNTISNIYCSKYKIFDDYDHALEDILIESPDILILMDDLSSEDGQMKYFLDNVRERPIQNNLKILAYTQRSTSDENARVTFAKFGITCCLPSNPGEQEKAIVSVLKTVQK